VFGAAVIPRAEARTIVATENDLAMYILANNLLFVNFKNANSNEIDAVKMRDVDIMLG
jgi:hypothetical protein